MSFDKVIYFSRVSYSASQIYSRLARLQVLSVARNGVEATLFDEACARLFEPKRNALTLALVAQSHHPIEVARTRFGSRLTSGYHLFDPLPDVVRREVDALQQRFADYPFVFYRHGAKNRQAIVGALTVLDRATNRHVLLPLAPVGG